MRSLQLYLQRLSGGEKQARQTGPDRIPFAEDDRGEGDEATSRRHAVGELMLIEGEIRAAKPCDNAAGHNGDVANPSDGNADRCRRLWVLAHSAHAQSKRRAV